MGLSQLTEGHRTSSTCRLIHVKNPIDHQMVPCSDLFLVFFGLPHFPSYLERYFFLLQWAYKSWMNLKWGLLKQVAAEAVSCPSSAQSPYLWYFDIWSMSLSFVKPTLYFEFFVVYLFKGEQSFHNVIVLFRENDTSLIFSDFFRSDTSTYTVSCGLQKPKIPTFSIAKQREIFACLFI